MRALKLVLCSCPMTAVRGYLIGVQAKVAAGTSSAASLRRRQVWLQQASFARLGTRVACLPSFSRRSIAGLSLRGGGDDSAAPRRLSQPLLPPARRSSSLLASVQEAVKEGSKAVEPSTARVAGLREWMATAGVDAFIVPSDDPHLSEYSADCHARREFISGFTGSAGTVVITKDKALLWTDGRYFLQAERELSDGWDLMRTGEKDVPSLTEWLSTSLPAGSTVGIDPFVHSIQFAQDLGASLEPKGIVLQPLTHDGSANPVDAVWGLAKPSPPAFEARVHPLQHAGKTVPQKLAEVRAAMRKEGADVLVLCMLDEIAYMFNIRGADIPHCPVVMAFAIIEAATAAPADKAKLPTAAPLGTETEFAEAGCSAQQPAAAATLFIDQAKIPEGGAVAEQLMAAGVAVRPYEEALAAVLKLAEAKRRIWLDPARSTFAFAAAVPRDLRVTRASPLALAKAIKNEAELAGMRASHVRDGAAMVRFLAWLDEAVRGGETFTEVEVDEHLHRFRSADPLFLDVSFPTIAGSGPNGAVIHYRAEPATCGVVDANNMFLLDSGAQYVDGTTDVTRTMHFGTPRPFEKEVFTRVLQGNIGVDSTVFPEGTAGALVDSFARRALWEAGLDYPHGTGHGVGAALNVHEGPHSISPRLLNRTPLEPGMIVSNEPGYYEAGQFGVRIENLLVVKEVPARPTSRAALGAVNGEAAGETPSGAGRRKFLGFEPLTLIPIQKSLIDVSLMSGAELDWLDTYHAHVWREIGPLVDGKAKKWLQRATEPVKRT